MSRVRAWSDGAEEAVAAWPELEVEVVRERVDAAFVARTALRRPFLVDDAAGVLGMSLPPRDVDVTAELGPRHLVPVIDVASQVTLTQPWTLGAWGVYLAMPREARQALGVGALNVISLEVTGTRLAGRVQAPEAVRDGDWVSRFWPPGQRAAARAAPAAAQGGGASAAGSGDDELDVPAFPKVEKYCLMTAAGSYTDFHTDFGGSSVWYHVLRGEKQFLLVEPTDKNLEAYEHWCQTYKSRFFGSLAPDGCHRLVVREGQTVLLPAGWVHAVYTPVDSLVFGGNFLHDRAAAMQVRCEELDRRCGLTARYRFPHFWDACWRAADNLAGRLERGDADADGGVKAAASSLAAALAARLARGDEGEAPPPGRAALAARLRAAAGGLEAPDPAGQAPPPPPEPVGELDAHEAPPPVEDALERVRVYHRTMRRNARSATWCRYCGSRKSRKWRDSAWGPRTLCDRHYQTLCAGDLPVTPGEANEPSAPLAPAESTEAYYTAVAVAKKFAPKEEEEATGAPAPATAAVPKLRIKVTLKEEEEAEEAEPELLRDPAPEAGRRVRITLDGETAAEMRLQPAAHADPGSDRAVASGESESDDDAVLEAQRAIFGTDSDNDDDAAAAASFGDDLKGDDDDDDEYVDGVDSEPDQGGALDSDDPEWNSRRPAGKRKPKRAKPAAAPAKKRAVAKFRVRVAAPPPAPAAAPPAPAPPAPKPRPKPKRRGKPSLRERLKKRRR